MKEHQIRVDILLRCLMQLLICAVFVVIIMKLKPLFNGTVDELDIVKEGLIIRLAPVIHGIDMLYAGFEIFVPFASSVPLYLSRPFVNVNPSVCDAYSQKSAFIIGVAVRTVSEYLIAA